MRFRVLAALVATASATPADTQFAQNQLCGAKPRKGGLQQVRPDEYCQPGPVWVDPMGQGQAGEDQRAGEGSDCIFHFHTGDACLVEFNDQIIY